MWVVGAFSDILFHSQNSTVGFFCWLVWLGWFFSFFVFRKAIINSILGLWEPVSVFLFYSVMNSGGLTGMKPYIQTAENNVNHTAVLMRIMHVSFFRLVAPRAALFSSPSIKSDFIPWSGIRTLYFLSKFLHVSQSFCLSLNYW